VRTGVYPRHAQGRPQLREPGDVCAIQVRKIVCDTDSSNPYNTNATIRSFLVPTHLLQQLDAGAVHES
jgi:hypothetical protein